MIEEYVARNNRHAEPFIWTATAATTSARCVTVNTHERTANWTVNCIWASERVRRIRYFRSAAFAGIGTVGTMMCAYLVPFHITQGPPLCGSVGKAAN